MRSLLFVLLSAGFACAQVNSLDPETVFKKVDNGLSSLTTRTYIQDVRDPEVENKQQEFTNSYSGGDLESVKFTFPQEDSHTFSHKYADDGKAQERDEYDSGGQLVTKWTYKYSDDGSFKVTELGKENSKVVWSYDSGGKLENAEFSDSHGVYSKLENTYDDKGQLIRSEDSNVKDGKETLFRKTEFSYRKTGALSGAKTYRGDGTLSISRNYNDRGDLVTSYLYSTNGEIVLHAEQTPVYKDNGHGSEKVSEAWQLFRGSADAVMMQGRAEYDRTYSK